MVTETIFIDKMEGGLISLEIGEDSIGAIKKKLSDEINISPGHIVLTFDSKILASNNIKLSEIRTSRPGDPSDPSDPKLPEHKLQLLNFTEEGVKARAQRHGKYKKRKTKKR